MIQKEAVKEFLSNLETPAIKKFFLIEWLTDINWHTESGLIDESLTRFERAEIEQLQRVDYLVNPAAYSRQYVKNFKPDAKERELADQIISGEASAYQSSGSISRKINNFERAKQFQVAMSHLYGWGICSKDWTSEGKGQKFVEELLELVGGK